MRYSAPNEEAVTAPVTITSVRAQSATLVHVGDCFDDKITRRGIGISGRFDAAEKRETGRTTAAVSAAAQHRPQRCFGDEQQQRYQERASFIAQAESNDLRPESQPSRRRNGSTITGCFEKTTQQQGQQPDKTECPRQTGPVARVSGSAPPAKRRWVPPSTLLRHRDAINPEARNDLIFRKVRGILNKLTPEKFQKLSDDLLRAELDSKVILHGVILLIFEKALEEPKYSSMYAHLCKRLSEEAPNFETPDSPCTFKVLLLNKCRTEFENRSAASEAFNNYGGKLSSEDEERRHLTKCKMLGNIKFIGELGKLDILSEGILHRCIQQLLQQQKTAQRRSPQSGQPVQPAQDCSEDLECLAQLVRTCGKILDNAKGKKLMDQYFSRMEAVAQNPELAPRIRFMLRDVIELRRDGWVPRKATSTEGPRPIHQIRGDEDLRSSYSSMRSGGRDSGLGGLGRDHRDHRDSDQDSWMGGLSLKLRGMNDMFNGLNVSSPSTNLIPPPHHDKFNFNSNGFGPSRNEHRTNSEGSFRGHNNQHGQGRDRGPGSAGGNHGNNRGYNNNGGKHGNMGGIYGNNVNKDIAPRFKKNFNLLQQGAEEVQMRPAANSLLYKANNIKTTTPPPSMLPLGGPTNRNSHHTPMHSGNLSESNLSNSGSGLNSKPAPPAPVGALHKETPLIIKQASAEKPKQAKKDKGPNKEELLKKVLALLTENLQSSEDGKIIENVDIDKMTTSYKDLKIPDKFAKDIVTAILNEVIEKNDVVKERAISFLSSLRKESLVPASACTENFRHLFTSISDKEETAHGSVAAILSNVVMSKLMTLADLASLAENGQCYPLYFAILEYLVKVLDKDAVKDMLDSSKVNLMSVLPECDRTQDRLAEILEDRGLSFLYPLLRVRAELWKQLQADPNPQQFYKWVKDNLEVSYHTDPAFVYEFVTVLLKYITQESTLAEGIDVAVQPPKALQEKEKSLLERFQVVLQAFLNGRSDLQLTAVFALQVYCFTHNFPKGMLLRFFMNLYDLEVIEEDAFVQWKEDLTEAYPGKGQALFQVYQWLLWLQEAESTDEEGED